MIVLRGARERVKVIEFSPDGRTLAAPFSGGVQLWNDLTDGGRPAVVLDYEDVRSARFTPDGRKLLLSGGGRGRVVLHDLPAGEPVEVTPESSDPATGEADLTPDGRYVVTVINSVWDEQSVLACRPVADPASPVWSVSTPRCITSPPLFPGGGGRFAVFEREPKIIPFWYVTRDTRTGEVVAEARATGQEFYTPVMSPDGRWIAGWQGVWVKVFRADDLGAEPVKLRNDGRKHFTGLAFHPSGRYLAATSNDQAVKLYDTTTWAVAEAYTWGVGRLRSVAFSPDGMRAAAGGDAGKVVVWDVDL
jgi:WD40 repeat protein